MSQVWQDGHKKWSMLSKRERRHLIINELKIPKYLRLWLAEMTEGFEPKMKFHHAVEDIVSYQEPPTPIEWQRLRQTMARACRFRLWLFIRFVFGKKS